MSTAPLVPNPSVAAVRTPDRAPAGPVAEPAASPAAAATRPSWAGPRAVGLGMLAIGVVALIATAAIPAARDGWSISGPRFFPLVASVGLIASSVAVLARTVVRPDVALATHAAAEARETNWAVTGLVAALLLGYVTLLEPLGYMASTALFFTLTARVLGSRSPVRDGVAGVALALTVDFVFTQLLAVPLPAGIAGF